MNTTEKQSYFPFASEKPTSLGLPYQGSKNRIATDIIAKLPSSEVFVDLFCGGCAMTHAALLSGKFQRAIINDIDGALPDLFLKALQEKIEFPGWMSREEFLATKGEDIFQDLVWSFGQSRKQYFSNKEREAVVREAYLMLTKESVEERYCAYREFIRKYTNFLFQFGVCLEHIEPIARINRIRNFFHHIDVKKICAYSLNYYEVPIPDNSLVYADPPYKGVEGFNGATFDNDVFWEWCRTRDFPVYVSEYNAPKDFDCIMIKEAQKIFGATSNRRFVEEKLFIHKKHNPKIMNETESTARKEEK